MTNWAVHIKFATARGAEEAFDREVRADGARAATEAVERQLARRRRGYRIRQIVTREIRAEEAA